TLMDLCSQRGVDVCRYGADLPAMAETELSRNIWAVRLAYHHLLQGGLCLRPPWSMVEHIGFDAQATNAAEDSTWCSSPLAPCPPLPERWPDPCVHPACAALWQKVYGARRDTPGLRHKVRGALRTLVTRLARTVPARGKSWTTG